VLAVGYKKTLSSSTAAAVVATSLAMVMSTSVFGACKTTLRGELVQAQTAPLRPVFLGKFLFFDLPKLRRPAKRVHRSAFSPS